MRTVVAALLAVATSLLSAQERQSAGVVRGRVTAHGNILPGVGLVARPSAGGPLVRLTSRAGGQFEFAGLPQGDYDLFAFLAGFDTARLIGARVRTTPFEADFGLDLRERLECIYVEEPPFGNIEGVVEDAKGFPLPFAVVEVKQLSGTRISRGRYLRAFGYANENGAYSANVPAGHHQVSATYPGYVARARDISVTVGKSVVLPLRAAESGVPKTSMESLPSFTNCGKLGFRNPAPAPGLR